jgi:Uncharacterized protein conserved in bacteria
MGSYDVRQVCLNGHIITNSYNSLPEDRSAFCSECGQATITACPKCETRLRGYYSPDAFVGGYSPDLPANCHSCGEPFPWAGKISKHGELAPEHALNQVFSGFHKVARQLRRRHSGRPTLDIKDEYDVQDMLHVLLCMFFSDIRPEEWTPSYVGGSARMDFLLKPEQTVIEVKMTRPTLKDKEIGDQLIIDIERYKAHPDCKKLVCFVYDPEGYVKNPVGLESDLNRTDEKLPVQVIIAPH